MVNIGTGAAFVKESGRNSLILPGGDGRQEAGQPLSFFFTSFQVYLFRR